MKIKVSSKPESFRRAGFAFTKKPQEIEVNQKTFDILKGEPMLVVEEIKEEAQVEVEVKEEVEKETKGISQGKQKGKGK